MFLRFVNRLAALAREIWTTSFWQVKLTATNLESNLPNGFRHTQAILKIADLVARYNLGRCN